MDETINSSELIPDRRKELEEEKLRLEINNLKRSPFNHPSFWLPFIPLGLAVVTYFWIYNTGFFDSKQAHLTYVTDTLQRRKAILDTLILAQKDSSRKLEIRLQIMQHSVDSMRRITEAAKAEAEAAKTKFKIHEETELTRKELIKLTEDFISLLEYDRTIERHREDSVEVLYGRLNDGNYAKATNARQNVYKDYMDNFSINRQTKAIYLRDKLLKYCPTYKSIAAFSYIHQTNGFDIENIVTDLTAMLSLIKKRNL